MDKSKLGIMLKAQESEDEKKKPCIKFLTYFKEFNVFNFIKKK